MRGKSRISVGLLAGVAVWAAAQSDEPTIFIPHYTTGGTVASLTVDLDTGAVTLVESEASGWVSALSLSPDGKLLVTGNAAGSADGSSTVDFAWVYEVNADASLTLLRNNAIPNSPLDVQFLGPTRVAILNSDLSNSRIFVYDIDPTDGTFMQVGSAETGGFATSLAWAPHLSLLYTADSNNDLLLAYRVGPTGSLSEAAAVSTAPYFALGLEMHPSAQFLYAGGGISGDVVHGYEASSVNPHLWAISGQPFASAGDSPFRVGFTRGGSVAVVGHGTDATIRSYLVDEATGALTPTGWFFDVGLQGSVGGMDGMGDLFFVTDDTSAIDGITGLYVFRANEQGLLTQIGGVISTGSARPEGQIAVWIPPCPPDLTGEGDVNTNDFFLYLMYYQVQDPRADFTGEGDINTNDFFAFLAAYQLGC